MTHAPETGAVNRLRFSSAGFWHVCHANLRPDSYLILASIRTLFSIPS